MKHHNEMWLNMWHPAFLKTCETLPKPCETLPSLLCETLWQVRTHRWKFRTSIFRKIPEHSECRDAIQHPHFHPILAWDRSSEILACLFEAASPRFNGPSSFEKGGLLPVIGFQCGTVMSPESVVGDTGCGVAQGHCRPLVISTTMRWSTKAVWSASKNWSTASLFQVCPPRLTWITKNIQLAYIIIYWLVVWNIIFPYIENVIIPTDLVIFFRGVGWNHQYYISFPIVFHDSLRFAMVFNARTSPFCAVHQLFIGIIGQLGYAMDCPFFLLSQAGVSQIRHATWYPLVIYGNLTPCYG